MTRMSDHPPVHHLRRALAYLDAHVAEARSLAEAEASKVRPEPQAPDGKPADSGKG